MEHVTLFGTVRYSEFAITFDVNYGVYVVLYRVLYTEKVRTIYEIFK